MHGTLLSVHGELILTSEYVKGALFPNLVAYDSLGDSLGVHHFLFVFYNPVYIWNINVKQFSISLTNSVN